ncbi:uncharacterized protein [Procambarus clarkii]|uniref:uncharacterized protein isoform X1 n=1 Tax=Procambarus clarkii TaxID=6728 RepID=UPI003743702A
MVPNHLHNCCSNVDLPEAGLSLYRPVQDLGLLEVRWWLWAGVVGVAAGVVGVAAGVFQTEMDRCRTNCSAVPEDLWPYCCETHHTCCQEFAESCIHDCLPRVHTGDVSAVEERPGLCCALYNLCCFRETFRIANRNQKIEPARLPIIHRFHVTPSPASRPQSEALGRTNPFQSTQALQTTEGDYTDEPPQEKTRANRFPLQRPQLSKKPTSRPRLPERPAFLKKPFGGSDESEHPLEQKNQLSDQNVHQDKPENETDKDGSLQDKKKIPEEDRRKSLLETKRPKSGPRLSGLLGRRKEAEEPRPIDDIQVVQNKEAPKETQRTPSGFPERGLLETRKSSVGESESTHTDQQGGVRRNLGGSRQRVTRKRVRVPGAPNGEESERERTDHVETEQQISRLQGTEEILARPLVNEGIAFGRQPVQQERGGSRTRVTEESVIHQPQVTDGRVLVLPSLVARAPLDEVTPPQPQNEVIGFGLPQLGEDLLLSQAQVSKEMDDRHVGQPQVAEAFSPSQITEEKIADRSLISEERLSSLAQLDREVPTLLKSAEENLFAFPQPVKSSEETLQAVARPTYLPLSAGPTYLPLSAEETPVDHSPTYLPLPTEENQVSQPQISERTTAGRSLIPNDIFINQPQVAVEKNQQPQTDIQVAIESDTPVGNLYDKLQVSATSVNDQILDAFELPEQSQVSVKIVEQPQVGVALLPNEPQLSVERASDQPEVTVKQMTDQTEITKESTIDKPQVAVARHNVGGRTRTRNQSQTRERSNSRDLSQVTLESSRALDQSQTERSSSTDLPQATQRISSRDRNRPSRERSSSTSRTLATQERSSTSDHSQVIGRSKAGVPPQTTRRRSSRRRPTSNTAA